MFLLKMESLIAGDIILTGNDEKLSRVIKKYTKGGFSHAILYVGHGSYIHSDRDGVHSNNIQRLLFESKDNVSVFRAIDNSIVPAVCQYARSQVGKEYSIPSAVNAQFKAPIEVASNRQFCSKLVAQAYEYAGLKLVKVSERCTPKEIEESPSLKRLDDIVREANDAEIDFANSESPLDKQTRVTNDILENARKIFDRDIQTLSELTAALFINPEHDSKISKLMLLSGYFSLWDEDLARNSWRYEYLSFMELPISKQEKVDLARREIESSKEMVSRFGSMLEHYKQAHEKYDLEYTRLHKSLYEKLLKAMLDNNKVASRVVSTLTVLAQTRSYISP
ncbi:YiiX/YebB-like N1pC/P60 family cysteine hydrolase [Pseudoalteromonas sp. MMG012]|uniref:YiiX/YebB-like N1pC/P60 family cysteine hydrolase n=1 Tax=Pseudoalteromonas sp. MMG012 TaxID=2822686 RepID=UPI001B3A3C50|nr:YiiX/YebB-like N1pC/P60 family cysteine hydrolase [Pseudoalteromonas sp. MMG012]MBQ4851047.1 hypothetical protein [Pseudoalteromonas sp. MMG012]